MNPMPCIPVNTARISFPEHLCRGNLLFGHRSRAPISILRITTERRLFFITQVLGAEDVYKRQDLPGMVVGYGYPSENHFNGQVYKQFTLLDFEPIKVCCELRPMKDYIEQEEEVI